jgi:hypothetical protein
LSLLSLSVVAVPPVSNSIILDYVVLLVSVISIVLSASLVLVKSAHHPSTCRLHTPRSTHVAVVAVAAGTESERGSCSLLCSTRSTSWLPPSCPPLPAAAAADASRATCFSSTSLFPHVRRNTWHLQHITASWSPGSKALIVVFLSLWELLKHNGLIVKPVIFYVESFGHLIRSVSMFM